MSGLQRLIAALGLDPREVELHAAQAEQRVRGFGREGTVTVHVHGPVYGGPAGLDELARRLKERIDKGGKK